MPSLNLIFIWLLRKTGTHKDTNLNPPCLILEAEIEFDIFVTNQYTSRYLSQIVVPVPVSIQNSCPEYQPIRFYLNQLIISISSTHIEVAVLAL